MCIFYDSQDSDDREYTAGNGAKGMSGCRLSGCRLKTGKR